MTEAEIRKNIAKGIREHIEEWGWTVDDLLKQLDRFEGDFQMSRAGQCAAQLITILLMAGEE